MQASTSLAYCRNRAYVPVSNTPISCQGYRASIFGPTASCLALVEVAEKIDTLASHSIHVVKNHDAIVARYFFVYSNDRALPSWAVADRLQLPQWDA